MSDEKIISGEQNARPSSEPFIAGEERKAETGAQPPAPVSSTLKERLAASTTAGGLKQLPENFDDQNGDWKLINSANPFEVLYLDHNKYMFITPEIVANNYQLLQKFWMDKFTKMNTGSNKFSFKNKYGEGTIENSQTKLKRSFEKLKTREGIDQYFQEINNERLRNGEERLKDSIEHMVIDGQASKREIQLCLERASRNDLTNDETAIIIQKAFDAINFKPYGTVSGNTVLEKLLSVNSWMTQAMIDQELRLEKERESLRIQILPGKYATTIESIGSILFEDPVQAKTFIKEDVLKSTIAQKDMVLGLEVGNISKKASKDLHAAFLEIIYKLNRALPYRFADNVYAKTVEEFCTLTFNNEQSLKLGKEQFKKGYVEIWLRETNTYAHEKFIKIRDSSENIDLAFLTFIYTFNPSLPYRFAGSQLIKTPEELFVAINANKASWEAGIVELYDSSIPVWLRTTGKVTIADKWNAIKNKYAENRNVGLEEFLHLLNENAAYPLIAVDKKEIKIPDIQSGQVIKSDIIFTNETRGHTNGALSLSKNLDGVTLSTDSIFHNAASGLNTARVTLSIDSSKLLKGVNYQTSILFRSSAAQQLEIPVSFKIVFPRNAFILETAKYAGLLGLVFALCRLVLASTYPEWLGKSFNAFVEYDTAVQYYSEFSPFGWTFFLLLCSMIFGAYLLTKYLLKK